MPISNHYDLNSWMAKLTEQAKNQPVNKLTLPGTHDSAAYRLDFSHPLRNSSLLFRIINYVADKIPFIGKIIKDWSITQSHTIREQLDMGIRQLDLRVSYCTKTDTFYLLHTFTCLPLKDALTEISDFLDKNKQEILIINMKSDWPHRRALTEKKEEIMFDLVNSHLGNKLCNKTINEKFDDTMTINKMVQENRKVIFSYGKHKVEAKDTPVERKFNWNRNNFETPWPDTSSLSKTLDALKKSLKEDLNFRADRINGLSFTLTPQAIDVIGDVIKRFFLFFAYSPKSVKTTTKKIHEKIDDFFKANVDEIKSNVTVISTDFATEKFTRSIIEMNNLVSSS